MKLTRHHMRVATPNPGQRWHGDGQARDKPSRQCKDAGPIRTVLLRELAVRPGSSLKGRSAVCIPLHARSGRYLLAISRQGRRHAAQLRLMKVQRRDEFLRQGGADWVAATGKAALAFLAGVMALAVLHTVPLSAVYEAVNSPVFVLLVALLPVDVRVMPVSVPMLWWM